MAKPRKDGRAFDDLRSTYFTLDFIGSATGSVLIEVGKTRIICTATVDESVPPFLNNTGKGWMTSEYSLLPAATNQRRPRDGRRGGHIDGRTQEIQRLIGRSLRAIVDLNKIGERTIWLDCDVIQADGGTRTASITGAYIALVRALKQLEKQNKLKAWPIKNQIAAISVGLVRGEPMLDLSYDEDSQADVDMNVVMTAEGQFVEVQGTAERGTMSRAQVDSLLDLAWGGIQELCRMQNELLQD
ncbi:MAG: ribonuclease PH [Planctomycetota bacterium]